MRVSFAFPRFHTNLYELTKNLLKKKNKVFFYSKCRGFTENHKYLRPIYIKESIVSKFLKFFFGSLNSNNFLYIPKWKDMNNSLKKKKPEVIFIRMHNIFYVYFMSFVSRINNVKILYYEQFEAKKKFESQNIFQRIKNFELKIRLFFFNAKWCTPISSPKNFKYPAGCFYLPFVCELKKNTPRNKKLRILNIGKFDSRKRHMLFLKVINNLKKKIQLEVFLVGEVKNHNQRKIYKYVTNYILENNLKKFVKIKKNIEHKKISKFYKKSNLFVLPSVREPASFSVLEAISYGIPVICSDSCGTKSYVRKDFGYIFQSDNQKYLEKKILAFSKLSLKQKTTKNKNAQKFCSQNLNFEKFNKILLDNL